MARRLPSLGAALALALAPAPAQAQTCLDCFSAQLGANPFTAPVVLPSQLLLNTTLGLAGPIEDPSWLPNVQAKLGLRDGLEAQATLGYEPSAGLRAVVAEVGGLAAIAAARGGWSYFRREWLIQAGLPLLWRPDEAWSWRIEPGVTLNQLSGHHLTCDLAVSHRVTPDTALMFTLSPDWLPSVQLLSGIAAVGVSRTLSPRWAAYGLATLVVIDKPVPMIGAGLTWTPPPLD